MTAPHTPMTTLAGLTDALLELSTLAAHTADVLKTDIEAATTLMRDAVSRGATLFFCGNGGSAADAQHMATEYVVRYMRNRKAYPAIALTTDTSLLTATGNDFGFDHIFERQVEALCKAGDVLVIHSTSGNSPNVLLAADAARRKGVQVLSFTAKGGGALAAKSDCNIIVPTDRTDRAQEIHLCIEHLICDSIERDLLR